MRNGNTPRNMVKSGTSPHSRDYLYNYPLLCPTNRTVLTRYDVTEEKVAALLIKNLLLVAAAIKELRKAEFHEFR